MYETMATISAEERPPCILTEDMFDAAMNQQFALQSQVESDGESSSQDENMEIECDILQGSKGSSDNALVAEPVSHKTDIGNALRDDPSDRESPAVSVLVIETGLDKFKQPSNNCDNSQACNRSVSTRSQEGNNNTMNPKSLNNDKAEENAVKLPLLKQILSRHSTDVPIDLYDTDTDDESPGTEVLDNDLKSVMQSNLMEEVGMNVSKCPTLQCGTSKSLKTNPPKVAVKSVAQVPLNIINVISKKKIDKTLNPAVSCPSTNTIRSVSDSGEATHQRALIPTTIHFNKIAVPHHGFVNNKGQRMKCLYMTSKGHPMPFIINSTPKPTNTRVAPHMISPQLKKIQNPLIPPIVTNMALKNGNQKKSVVPKVPAKQIAVTSKLHKPASLKNVPVRSHQFHLDNTVDSLIKSLLFKNLKEPYRPPVDVPGMNYPCVDCCDRFALQTSRNQHLARRSISICYWCRICKTELQFFNKCVFLRHVRGHGGSVANIDTTCITFNPLPQEMFDSGLVSTFLRDDGADGAQQVSLTNGVMSMSEALSSVIVPNPSSQILTTVTGVNKSKCLQTPSLLLNRPSSTSVDSEVSKQSQQLIALNTEKQPNHRLALKRKSAPNYIPSTGSLMFEPNNTSPMCTTASSSVTEIEIGDIDTIIDDDTITQSFHNEDADVDIETVTEKSMLPDVNETKQKTKTSVRQVCNECGTSCVNINRHLNGCYRPINPKFVCEFCKLILPTKCSLKIHSRLHTKSPPFKCPDCGRDFTNWQDVNLHVKYSCGHLAKCIRFLCISCKAHFETRSNLNSHILSEHLRDIFKCPLCKVAFYNRKSINTHLSYVHRNKDVLAVDYKQCSLCPNNQSKKLITTDMFLSHVNDHTESTSTMIYGYKCPFCFVVYSNKTAFIIHQYEEKKSNTKLKNKNFDSSRTQNVPVSDSNSDVEEEPMIYKKYPEPGDDSVPTEKDPLSLEDWERSQEPQVKERREELCIVCKENYVILLPGINLNDQSLCCKQCVRPLDILEPHRPVIDYSPGAPVRRKEPIRNGLNKVVKRKRSTPKGGQRSLSCDDAKGLGKKMKPNDTSPENDLANNYFSDGMRAKNKSRKKQCTDNVVMHMQGQVVNSKSSNTLLCAKCEFAADTRETFLDHITVHRTDPNTFQCLECGLCFVVLPSLERHLQINHGIKDVKVYTDKNSSSLPRDGPNEEETDDRQCQVCYEIFDCSSSLEKHFRSHGMAFMNRLSKSP